MTVAPDSPGWLRQIRAHGGLSLLSCSAGSGKSSYSVGILDALYRAGYCASPFKAVAVVGAADRSSSALPGFLRGIHHSAFAARQEPAVVFNPLTVVPTGDSIGDLYVLGELRGPIRLIRPDVPDMQSVSSGLFQECREVVNESWRTVREAYDYVIVEGAGGVGDLAENWDLANVHATRLAALPAVLLARWSSSGAPSSLLGAKAMLPFEVARLLVGFAFNDVVDRPIATRDAKRLTKLLELPYLGGTPRVPSMDPEVFDGSARAQRLLHQEWGNRLGQLDWEYVA